jgi:6-phosphogluconolactonase
MAFFLAARPNQHLRLMGNLIYWNITQKNYTTNLFIMNLYQLQLLIVFTFLVFTVIACNDEIELVEVNEYIYTGSFSGEGSKGLQVFEFDRVTGILTEIQVVDDRAGSNFQAIHPNGEVLYSVSDDRFDDEEPYGTISAYRIDRETGFLELMNEQSVQGRGTAHVSVDPLGNFVYVSNYSEGNLAVYQVYDDGSLSEAVDIVQHEGSSVNTNRQRAPHVHSIIPSDDGRFIYVSDLGIDKIKIYEVDRESGELSPASVPYFENEPGSGPRHFTFHPNGEFAYSAEELSVTVAVLSVDPETGALEQVQRLSLLPDGVEPDASISAADIHTSPDGRFLYASVRGEDLISIFSIEPETGLLDVVGYESAIGGHPRNFMVDEKGEFLLIANRDNDHVVVFRRDQETGEIEFTGIETEVPVAVCVTQLIVE